MREINMNVARNREWTKKGIVITGKSEHIRVEGHRGTWYVTDTAKYAKGRRERVFLLEHETYGDEATGIVINKHGTLILDDVWNGFDDLEEDGWTRQESQTFGKVAGRSCG